MTLINRYIILGQGELKKILPELNETKINMPINPLFNHLPEEFANYGGKCPTYIRPLSNFTFGAEFECLLPRLESTSSNADVRNTHINGYHSRYPDPVEWLPAYLNDDASRSSTHCESDSSVRTSRHGFTGVEFVTPPVKGALGVRYICNVADKLREEGCRVNATCGLHLHVGLKGIVGNAKVDDVVAFLAQLNKLVLNFQDGLYAQTGTRRDRNNYCRRHDKNESLMAVAKSVGDKRKGSKDQNDYCRLWDYAERYRCLNLRNLRRGMGDGKATLEFRFPAGTLNTDKIAMHLATIVFLCRLAWKTRHTKADSVTWDLNKGYQKQSSKAGVRTLKVLLRKMNSAKQGKYLKYESTIFADKWDSMQEVALRMAEKYDNRA